MLESYSSHQEVYSFPPTTGELYYSVGVSLAQDLKKRLDQYLEVEPKAPVVDVPKVKLHALRDMLDRRRRASRSVTLRPARYAWLDVMSVGVITYDILEIVFVGQGVRTRPDQ